MRFQRFLKISFSVGTILTLLVFVSGALRVSSATSAVVFPAYATAGAFANYTGSGGFIAFLSGVSGNLTYYVSSVFSNGTMQVQIQGNLSLGTEVGIPTSHVSENVSDSVFHPRVLPAIPPQNLTDPTIIFQNITCSFEKNAAISVPAGSFNATEFQGTGANGSVLNFWFDRASGLAVQMAGAGAEFQLLNSNIAVPIGFASNNSIGTQIIVVFIVGWVGAGLLFYSVRRYYLKKSKFLRSPAKYMPEDDPASDRKKKKSALR